MGQYTMKLSEGAAIMLIVSLAVSLVFVVTHFFTAFSFPWIAWCLLGFGTILTFGREMIAVRDPADGPPPGPIENSVNYALVRFLFSMPALFVASTAFLTLLIASAETFGLLPTLASIASLVLLVQRTLRIK
jgi:hypothetical protein